MKKFIPALPSLENNFTSGNTKDQILPAILARLCFIFFYMTGGQRQSTVVQTYMETALSLILHWFSLGLEQRVIFNSFI